jgi:hypothetical protein
VRGLTRTLSIFGVFAKIKGGRVGPAYIHAQ